MYTFILMGITKTIICSILIVIVLYKQHIYIYIYINNTIRKCFCV